MLNQQKIDRGQDPRRWRLTNLQNAHPKRDAEFRAERQRARTPSFRSNTRHRDRVIPCELGPNCGRFAVPPRNRQGERTRWLGREDLKLRISVEADARRAENCARHSWHAVRRLAAIIPCPSAPALSNNIMQKGLAFGRHRSGTVPNSRRYGRSGILPRRLDGRGGLRWCGAPPLSTERRISMSKNPKKQPSASPAPAVPTAKSA